MKPRLSKKRNQGMDIVDLLVIIAVLAILAVMIVPVYQAAHRRSSRIDCVSNLKQVNMALRVWHGDCGPESIPMTNAIPPGLNDGQVAWINQMGLSNILHSTNILRCSADMEKAPANPAFPVRISYFLNPGASETYPQMILSGDDDLLIGDGKHPRPVDGPAEGDVPVTPGILNFTADKTIAWGKRHGYCGNLGFADGSVTEGSSLGLANAIQYSTNGTPWATNRWAIP
jgi:hypothetical protein